MKLKDICSITTGKLDSNAATKFGKYPFFTCAPTSLKTDTFKFDGKSILIAGNNAQGDFHIQFFEGKFNAYQRTYVLQLKNDNFMLEFVFYELSIKLLAFKTMSQGSQTKFLTLDMLENIDIPDLALKEQLRITNIVHNRRNYEILSF